MLASTPYWQRMLVLVPAFVVGIGLVLAVLILLARALAQFVRESEHKTWIYIGLAGLVVAIVVLTYLGVKLPKE